jgi:hypothetical protein
MAPLRDPDMPAWIRGGHGRAAGSPSDGLLDRGGCRSGWRDVRNGSLGDVVLTALAPGVVAVLYGLVEATTQAT